TWKRLVEDLTKQGYESPHLDRLKERLPTRGSSFRELELEIAQEMASALGRAAEKVDLAFLELELLGRGVDEADRAGDATRRGSAVTAFNQKREHASKVLWELRVHREAIGLRRHEHLNENYRLPPKRQ